MAMTDRPTTIQMRWAAVTPVSGIACGRSASKPFAFFLSDSATDT